jgi:hypothetical protein
MYYTPFLPLRTEILNLICFKQTTAFLNVVLWSQIGCLLNDEQVVVFSEHCYIIWANGEPEILIASLSWRQTSAEQTNIMFFGTDWDCHHCDSWSGFESRQGQESFSSPKFRTISGARTAYCSVGIGILSRYKAAGGVRLSSHIWSWIRMNGVTPLLLQYAFLARKGKL